MSHGPGYVADENSPTRRHQSSNSLGEEEQHTAQDGVLIKMIQQASSTKPQVLDTEGGGGGGGEDVHQLQSTMPHPDDDGEPVRRTESSRKKRRKQREEDGEQINSTNVSMEAMDVGASGEIKKKKKKKKKSSSSSASPTPTTSLEHFSPTAAVSSSSASSPIPPPTGASAANDDDDDDGSARPRQKAQYSARESENDHNADRTGEGRGRASPPPPPSSPSALFPSPNAMEREGGAHGNPMLPPMEARKEFSHEMHMVNGCHGGSFTRTNPDTGSVSSFSAEKKAIGENQANPVSSSADRHHDGDEYEIDPLDQYPAGQEPAEAIIGRQIYLESDGKYILLFGGRLLLGPNWPRLLISLGALTFPFLLTAAFILPYAHWSLIVINIVFFAMTIVFLLRAAMMDPGIVPKRESTDDCPFSHTMFFIRKKFSTEHIQIEDRFTKKRAKEQKEREEQQAAQEEEEARQRRRLEEESGQWSPSSPPRDSDASTLGPESNQGGSFDGSAGIATGSGMGGGGDRRGRGHIMIPAPQDEDDREGDQQQPAEATSTKQNPEGGVEVDKYRVTVKYCNTCHRYKGPRTHHCKQCDRCIDLFDHHCPWTGTCVGARNYASFLWFIHSLQLLILSFVILIIATPVLVSEDEDIHIIDALGKMYYFPIILFVFMIAAGWAVTGLTLFHDYLIYHATTTFEHLRGAYLEPIVPPIDKLNENGEYHPSWINPYDLGLGMNCLRFFGQYDPIVKSVHFDGKIVDLIREKRLEAWKRNHKNELNNALPAMNRGF